MGLLTSGPSCLHWSHCPKLLRGRRKWDWAHCCSLLDLLSHSVLQRNAWQGKQQRSLQRAKYSALRLGDSPAASPRVRADQGTQSTDEKLQMGPESAPSQPPPLVSLPSETLHRPAPRPEHPASKGLLSALHTKELKDQHFYKGKNISNDKHVHWPST